MNKQSIMVTGWFIIAAYVGFSSLIISSIGVLGLDTLEKNDPTAFDESILNFELLWFMLSIHPILIIGLFFSIWFMNIKFKIPFRKDKDE